MQTPARSFSLLVVEVDGYSPSSLEQARDGVHDTTIVAQQPFESVAEFSSRLVERNRACEARRRDPRESKPRVQRAQRHGSHRGADSPRANDARREPRPLRLRRVDDESELVAPSSARSDSSDLPRARTAKRRRSRKKTPSRPLHCKEWPDSPISNRVPSDGDGCPNAPMLRRDRRYAIDSTQGTFSSVPHG